MGSSNKEKSRTLSNDKEEKDASHKEVQKIVKITIACFVSFLVSLAGGMLLAWWQYEYHPDNRQLWMVPFGLILFTTPAIVWFSVVFSDICTPNTNDDTTAATQPGIPSLDDSTPDPER